jgi:2-dehydro-3-deoxygluconokinase
MSADLLCMGEPMLEFNQLPPEADGRRLYLEGFGGDTSNTAVGEDAGGDAFLRLWQEEGVDTSTVLRRKGLPTAVYFVMRRPGGHEFLFYREGSAAASYSPGDLPREVIAAARIFYASGISQAISTSAADAVFLAMDVAREGGAAIAYDTNYRSRLWPAARGAAVIHAAGARAGYLFVSSEDARALTGLTDPDAILDFYLSLGPRIVLLKRGGEGAILATADSRIRISPPAVEALDSTGAGDVLSGAFLARILAGDQPDAAARYGVAAAALSTRGYGAVGPIPYREEVLRVLAQAG